MADGSEVFLGSPQETPIESRNPDAPKPKKSRFGGKKLMILVFIILAVLGFGGWKYRQNHNTTKTATSLPTDSTANRAASDIEETSETKTFKGDHPRIEFTYPANWTVSENDGGVRVESPEFSYMTTNLGEVNGHFRVYIRQGARQVDGKYIGRGQAVEDSEKLAYSAPVTGQRPETNLSSFGLDSTEHFAFFLIAGNFTLKKGDSLGPDYGKEPETYIVAGGFSSKDLTDDLATNAVPLETYKQTTAYKQAIEIIKSLKLL